MYNAYTLDGKFIKKYSFNEQWPIKFSGILKFDNGEIQYYKNGEPHRIDGPAIINCHNINSSNYFDVCDEYWVNGEYIEAKTPEEFKLFIDLLRLKGLL